MLGACLVSSILIPSSRSSVQVPVPNTCPGQIPEFAVILLNLLQGLGVDLLLQVFHHLAAWRRRPLWVLQGCEGIRGQAGGGVPVCSEPWVSPVGPPSAPHSSPFVKSTVCSLRLPPLSRREGSLEKW